jgi:DNA replication protein DnaC
MKKIFQLQQEGKHPERVLDAIKNEVRKYIKRERAKALPAGVDFWDFDCRFGESAQAAQVAHVAALTQLMNEAQQAGNAQFYLEILAKPGVRTARPPAEEHKENGEV